MTVYGLAVIAEKTVLRNSAAAQCRRAVRSMRLEVSHVIGQQQPMGAKGGIAPPLQLASNELNMLFLKIYKN